MVNRFIFYLCGVLVLSALAFIAGHVSAQERDESARVLVWQPHHNVEVVETPGACIYLFFPFVGKAATGKAATMKVIPRTQLPSGKGC